MPVVALPSSPLLPGVSPVEIAYRDEGSGPPLLFLHGGWGHAFYPLEPVPGHRLLIPDRTGYGRSPRIADFPRPFHAAAQGEHERFLDALGISRCALWGHSDGAVIAARMAIANPSRYSAVVLEALHLDRVKPASRAFFTMMAEDPDGFGERVTAKLAADHGEDYWRTVIRAGGRSWLDIAATPDNDLLDRRLTELRVPTLVLHGAEDPRTEPGELDRLRREVPHAEIHLLAGAGHSPHSERASRATSAELVAAFLARVIRG
ncbi:MAG: alpha/beta fold hydrolase [Deltaproteobacteria bacterium]|nr:alpha/beta fold hydrolase [Deltaproteobacteria bacterium]